VQPNRLSVEGHGEYQPIADNATAAGRQQNRRVVISISRKQSVTKAAPQLDSDRTAANQQQNEQTGLVKEEEQKYEIIRLPGGGILIRGKESPENENNQ
jgi:chemotaxis protein MotB